MSTEGVIYAKHILATVKDPKIGVLMQNDDYGKDYFNGFKAGLGKDADKIVQLATYEVTDPTVDSQMIQLKNSGANVFFNITIPKFAAQAIKKAAEIGWKPIHYLNNVSSSVGAVMKPAGLEASQGIIPALYRKDPTDPQWANAPDIAAWKAFMAEVHATGRPARRWQRLWLCSCQHHGRGAEEVRRQSDARERHEAGRQPEGLRGCRCFCRASRSTPARPISIRSRPYGWRE